MSTDEKWYEKYVGFPYLHLGNDIHEGIDCFNLVRLVYRQELSIDIPYDTSDFCDILDEQWYNKTHDRPFEKGATLRYGWEKTDVPEIYGLIIMTIGSTNCANHCSIYVDKNKMLQTMLNHSSWIAPYGRYYKQYTIGTYKWNPVHMKI